MWRTLFFIGIGGFFGSISRYLTGKYIQQLVNTPFPYGTFIVNITGCFLIGLFFGLSEKSNLLNQEWRVFLTVGFCGGFTTFSSFAFENIALLRAGEFSYFLLYTGLTILFCLTATFLGNVFIKTVI